MSTLYAYIICEFSTEVVLSFEFQYRGCTKFLCPWTKFVQVSEFSTKVVLSQAWPDPRGKTEGQGKYVYQTCSALKWLRVELDASMKPRVP